ncbi:MAG: site-2 protease family protein [Planctomycetes bacterium]|nr:site-2 protease family protein [Planctomycetota bacterium]
MRAVDGYAILVAILAYLVSLSVHESAHAWVALRLGDPTGQRLGRVSLNPARHVDPVGTVLLPLLLAWSSHGQVIFGYAKPVPYNPYLMRNPQLGAATVAAAGPASNFVLALVAAVLLGLLAPDARLGGTLGLDFLFRLVTVNVALGVFNLVPLPPLDGGTIVAGLLPRRAGPAWARLELLAPVVLVALMATGTLGRIIGPAMERAVEFLLRLAWSLRG